MCHSNKSAALGQTQNGFWPERIETNRNILWLRQKWHRMLSRSAVYQKRPVCVNAQGKIRRKPSVFARFVTCNRLHERHHRSQLTTRLAPWACLSLHENADSRAAILHVCTGHSGLPRAIVCFKRATAICLLLPNHCTLPIVLTVRSLAETPHHLLWGMHRMS